MESMPPLRITLPIIVPSRVFDARLGYGYTQRHNEMAAKRTVEKRRLETSPCRAGHTQLRRCSHISSTESISTLNCSCVSTGMPRVSQASPAPGARVWTATPSRPATPHRRHAGKKQGSFAERSGEIKLWPCLSSGRSGPA